MIITTSKLVDCSNGFLINDEITIEAHIATTSPQYFNPTYSIGDNVKVMLFDDKTCDLYIVVNTCSNSFDLEESEIINRPFPVHKFILQIRSPVFKTMLLSTMKESTSNEIIISDFDHDVVKEFIRFLYLDTCDATVLDKHAKSLLAMAHKYDVKGLVKISVDHLIKRLNLESVVELFKLGDVFDSTGLKAGALKFIKSNTKILVKDGR